ncbi:hypothetical protein AUEXF2481DRAFT_30697 [Aureobasidium subglaciale EXF-2481]|uniref:G protein-coupled receptor GPR1/2/3 C-terminal domain-containing protein n=1 Tax=Aureobasidium subglaciale (strain EXF-2481) TaxID=1043005 RepID=A0A074YJA2_AURSE|nr:uncharacterized protein AUEXF2481DRAFT_30697 [Aureobasidium subglaciale EXF-2481]KAI5208326.1 hypothetical protein E4T38_02867 [Aureobasidium subglaciale]KAI5227206.1 hypothetical protein E4T40_02696 [Aureobasidium subglaciale]KAI5230521.1 hypothetical protein E4T41_02866 [Aureobasidium subglaciale]KAI5264992.1 hypothetical protein E4T46_02644 [Aureobasidium subglaciale]KEQ94152.1 hypothetical protein AUEXF2481DRAFT_30697 [Aureobasidium subglaciale EXF-2481]
MATVLGVAVASATTPTSTLPSEYFPFPESMSPLPQSLKTGMLVPGTIGLLSAASSIGMLLFIIYRFLTWRAHYRTFVGYNQYVALIINLLCADLLQGVAFMFSYHWVFTDGIVAPSLKCTSQGFLLNAGNLSSGYFVMAIALHTFYGAVKGRHLKPAIFYPILAGGWFFALFLSAMGPIIHGNHYYVRAGAWCWAAPEFQTERLAFHYIWIFVVQFGTVIVYLLIFLHLKNTLTTILPSSHSTTHAKVDRAARLMLMFPLAYIILTLPLSAGRMWSMAHHTYNIHEGYQLASGALIACSGMVDCLLYTLTRRSLVQSTTSTTNKSTISSNLDSYDLSRLNGITQTRTVTVTGDRVSTISNTSHISEDDDAYSMRTISTTPRKKHTLREPPRAHSPTSSIDRIMGVEGLDPRKPAHKVQISTYEARVSEDVDSLRESERSDSPVNVMRGLAKMVKLPNLMDRK